MHDTDLHTVLWYKFSLFIATKSFKTRFWVKFPVAKGLINVVLAVIFSGKEKKRKSFHSKGWRRSESARLPPMWPGFKSRRRRHMWVEFVVGSLPCSARFFSGYSSFPLPSNSTSIWNAQTRFNEFLWTPWCSLGKQITIFFVYYSKNPHYKILSFSKLG